MRSPGQVLRSLLGDRYARIAGSRYRAIFVNMAKATAAIADELPANAHVLDVGGGDGEPLNWLLALRGDVRITTIDVAPGVGRWIDPSHHERVTCIDSMSLQGYLDSARPLPDVLLLSDVIHHVPVAARTGFFAVVASAFQRRPHLRVIIKDVEPGHWRATLGRLSDRYLTADRGVELVARDQMIAAMRRACGAVRHRDTPLLAADPPNYAIVFDR